MRALRCSAVAIARCLALPPVRPRTVQLPVACLANPNPFLPCHARPRIGQFSTAVHSAGTEPTIYALSTASGQAAIAIVRISGIACKNIYHAVCPKKPLPAPRCASVRSIYEPSPTSGSANVLLLDSSALVLYFPAPKTATGEDILELHIHGGPAVVKAVLNAVGRCNSIATPVRYAEPGEFTRRAFFNDRVDLTQVEALGETLAAVTEEQRRISVQGTRGALAARYESWRQLLLSARGELEALIDFSEDQHFDESPASLAESVAVQVRALASRIDYHSANSIRGELLRNGISMSLIGAPNVGKSSLLNLIVGRNAAIVSQQAGTTRDVVEIGIDLGGFFCRLGDTAGLRQAFTKPGSLHDSNSVVGDIEKEGMRRARERAQQSDIVILVLSVEPSIENQGAQLSLDPEVLHTATELLNGGKTLVVAINKIDNYSHDTDPALLAEKLTYAVQTVLPAVPAARIFCLSCRKAELHNVGGNGPHAGRGRGRGDSENRMSPDPGSLQAFLAGLTGTFKSLTAPLVPADDASLASASATSAMSDIVSGPPSDPSIWQESLGATQRQRALLEECTAHLHDFLAHIDTAAVDAPLLPSANSDPSHAAEEIDIVAAAESLRAAAQSLAKITGRGSAGDVEEVLGVVFEK